MNRSRLDCLARKNRGKLIYRQYKEAFIHAGFQDNELIHVSLEESDVILEELRWAARNFNEKEEILPNDISLSDSKILSAILKYSNDDCYVFSDDVDTCGLYLTTIKAATRSCLNVAKQSDGDTCFVLDKKFRFSLRINFYRDGEKDLINKFDIQFNYLKVYFGFI